MRDRELREEVRRLRGVGLSPTEIARALGVRRSVISPLVRSLAAQAPAAPAGSGPLMGCWVSPGWSRELIVESREGWDDVDLGPDGPAGVALVLVARATRHDRLSVAGFLLDTFCLGVKNVLGPDEMRARDLPAFVRTYFMVFPSAPLAAPIDLARHLVFGCAAYAGVLGFSTHSDFAAVRGHLGELDEPCAIAFGQRGRPLYVPGPDDDPGAVLETLLATLGSDGFAVAA